MASYSGILRRATSSKLLGSQRAQKGMILLTTVLLVGNWEAQQASFIGPSPAQELPVADYGAVLMKPLSSKRRVEIR